MALTCPRCGTDVQTEAMYCPYCSLPKPKTGFAAVDVNAGQFQSDQPNASVGFESSPRDHKSPSSRPGKKTGKTTRKTRQAKPGRRLRLPVVSVAALVALLCVGIYIFIVPLVYSGQAEPKVVLSALDTLRRMPSNEAGLTIDARLTHELEASRRVKNLVAYQGWTVRPIKGTTTRVLIAFSYQEVGDVTQRAEWVADLTNNTFTPQSDLARAVHAK